jgi:hypothetical protein
VKLSPDDNGQFLAFAESFADQQTSNDTDCRSPSAFIQSRSATSSTDPLGIELKPREVESTRRPRPKKSPTRAPYRIELAEPAIADRCPRYVSRLGTETVQRLKLGRSSGWELIGETSVNAGAAGLDPTSRVDDRSSCWAHRCAKRMRKPMPRSRGASFSWDELWTGMRLHRRMT